MAEWRSESVWGIRSLHDIRTAVDAFRTRPVPSLGWLLSRGDGAPAGPDRGRVERAAARDRALFARQERVLRANQGRMLQARARLQQVRETHRAIQEARRGLMAARLERMREARRAAGRWRQAGRNGVGIASGRGAP
jgi:hypothetical protein